jgi:hypothetical protein
LHHHIRTSPVQGSFPAVLDMVKALGFESDYHPELVDVKTDGGNPAVLGEPKAGAGWSCAQLSGLSEMA